MSVRPLETGKDNKILRSPSKEIKKVNSEVKKLAKDLHDSLKKYKGLGLAAPQIGVNLKVMVVVLNYNTDQEVELIMVNPNITFFSKKTVIKEEGCLSLPNLFIKIRRSDEIIVEFLNIKNKKQALSLKDLNARVVQHELDHLSCVLISDREEENN